MNNPGMNSPGMKGPGMKGPGPIGSGLTPGERAALVLYSLAWILATPLAMAYLAWRARRQPEYRRHWRERWAWWRGGVPSAAPGDDRPLWIHAVSVGETRAAQPLIEALLARDARLTILLTHMTPTGRATGEELFARRWPQRVRQQYLPYDHGWAIRRFLARWRPSLGVIMETELWPNVCAGAARAGVPLVLVNARLSERSLRKGLRWRALIGPALRSLAGVLAQTDADAARLRRLGRDDVAVLGNLKFDFAAPPQGLALGAGWRGALAGRAVVVLASSRDGEEAAVLAAWRQFRPAGAMAPLLLIVPRHPQRFDEVAGLVRSAGFALRRRTGPWLDQGSLEDDAPVLLGDSMGEMAAYYALADVAIIGGSLLPFGAQNLIEACAIGVPVVVGPHTFNFEQAAVQAIEAGAACRVADAVGAVSRALALAGDGEERAAMAGAARRFAAAHRGATDRTVRALAPWLEGSAPARRVAGPAAPADAAWPPV
jgi:3-deoxy-D-manno-octulosonic-acid transferase